MKCPKTLHAKSVVGDKVQWVYEDCLMLECAWYRQRSGYCAILDMALSLISIDTSLANLSRTYVGKMRL